MSTQCENCPIGHMVNFLCDRKKSFRHPDVSENFSTHRLKAEEVLDEDMRQSRFLIVLCSGIMGMQHMIADGRRTISELFTPGDLIVGARVPKDSEIFAISDVELTYIPVSNFEKARLEESRLERLAMTRLARQSQSCSQHCADIAKKTPPEKLASFIAEFRDRMALSHHDWQKLIRKIKRRDIADYLALEAETVSRSFTRLADADVIKLNKNASIEILNEARLEKIANGGWPRRRKQL